MKQLPNSSNSKKGKGNHGASLTQSEFNWLSKYLDRFTSKTEPALNLGVDRMVLWRLINVGTISSDNIQKIRDRIKDIKANDLYEHSAE